MSTHTLSRDDVAPLLEGLAILGTGGGGSPSWGKAILEHDFSMGRTPSIIPLQDLDDDATVVSGGMMGSVKVLEDMGIDGMVKHWEERFELLEVTRVMEGILGRSIDHVVPFEVGGLNTPVILSLGARMGIPVIDGDALGRSAPETQMTSFIGHGVSLTPMPLIDYAGNVVIVQEAAEPTYPDELGRWVVTHGGGMGANNHYPMSGRQAKEAIVPNTISKALELGLAVLRARQKGQDPIATATEVLDGVPLFSGSVVRLQEEEKMGFYYTVVDLHGTGSDKGRVARLVIKNETMLLSIEGSIKAIFPDLVCMLERGTGRGVMSVELAEGMALTLVGVRCHERLREALVSEVGACAFSPARYGYPDLEYQPIEELVEGFR
ncbi:MAG: DUF917 domain-containing protein [Anaerolineae bacterium]|nr:DUF917 domain-containing protein [Anaerolineae bacterium]